MRMFSAIVSSLLFAWAFTAARPAAADDTIKIGEINSYSAIPSFTEPYRKGWQLALDEINSAGGVDGKKFEVISKDDGGKPADAVTAANELVAWADGKLSCVGVSVSGGRSASCGRGRRTTTLTAVLSRYAPATVEQFQKLWKTATQ